MPDEKVTMEFTVDREIVQRILKLEKADSAPLWALLEDLEVLLDTIRIHGPISHANLRTETDLNYSGLVDSGLMDALRNEEGGLGFIRMISDGYVLGPEFEE